MGHVGPPYTEMIPNHKLFAYREMVTPDILRIVVGLAVAMIVLFVVLGPLETIHTQSWIERLAFWGVLGIVDISIGYAAYVFTLYVVRSRPLLYGRVAVAIMSAILAGAFVILTFGGYVLFHGGDSPNVGVLNLYLFNLVYTLFLVALADSLVQMRLNIKKTTMIPDSLDEATACAGSEFEQDPEDDSLVDRDSALQQNGFFDRLPPRLGHDVIYLKVSDHYVDVTTAAGSAVILMRLSDAVAALGDLGMRVHRSYWVAYGHITRLIRQERRTLVRVTNGQELPVSRARVAELRDRLEHRGEMAARGAMSSHGDSPT